MPRLSHAAREELAASRRAAITAAATKAFSQRGYQHATVQEIASAAGVAEGTIYLYFRNKRDLLMQAWETVAVGSLIPLLTADEPLEARLEAIVRDRLALISEHGALMRVVLAEADRDPSLLQILAGRQEPVRRLAEGYLAEGMRAGIFRDLRPPAVVRVIIGAIFGMVVTKPFVEALGFDVSREEEAGTLATLLLHGLLARDGKE